MSNIETIACFIGFVFLGLTIGVAIGKKKTAPLIASVMCALGLMRFLIAHWHA